MYPNGDYLYDRPVMYNDLPAYMPSYRDLMDRKARTLDNLGREVQEKTGTRKEMAEYAVPPSRIATQGYRPGLNRGSQPSYQIGAGFHGERTAQDVSNSFSHHHHVEDRFERSKHKVDWNSWTREEYHPSHRRVRRHGDEELDDGHGKYGVHHDHALRAPPGATKGRGQITNATIQQSRAHGNVISSTKPLMTL
jgi:hypothetical protein